MSGVRAVVSDFGGVLTLPLSVAFEGMREELGIGPADLGGAMAHATEAGGENPLYALERGEVSERAFLDALGHSLEAVTGREVTLDGFGEQWFAQLKVNEPLLGYYRGLRERGLRLAILTNNVREWEPRWRAMLPIDELFELVVDSAFVGMRKPEPGIYELTLSRLGLAAEACVFVDDLEPNVSAARALGLHAVHFRTTEQAVAELDALLA